MYLCTCILHGRSEATNTENVWWINSVTINSWTDLCYFLILYWAWSRLIDVSVIQLYSTYTMMEMGTVVVGFNSTILYNSKWLISLRNSLGKAVHFLQFWCCFRCCFQCFSLFISCVSIFSILLWILCSPICCLEHFVILCLYKYCFSGAKNNVWKLRQKKSLRDSVSYSSRNHNKNLK